MCRVMNRSCLPIKVEQVKESLLTRRYFPLGKKNKKICLVTLKAVVSPYLINSEKSIAYRRVARLSFPSSFSFSLFDLI